MCLLHCKPQRFPMQKSKTCSPLGRPDLKISPKIHRGKKEKKFLKIVIRMGEKIIDM